MASTALALIKAFCKLKGIAVPASIVDAAQDAGVNQLVELYNKVGRHITSYKSWQVLSRRATHVQLAAEDQGLLSAICAENLDHIVVDTLWNNTLRQPIFGPLSDQQWQADKALLPSGPMQMYKVYQGHLYILGTTTAGHELFIFYKSKNWLQTGAATGLFVDGVTLDTNVPIFPDFLMSLGLEAFWRQEKDLPFQTQMAAFTAELVNQAGNDATASKLKMHEANQPIVKPGIIVPAGNWPVS